MRLSLLFVILFASLIQATTLFNGLQTTVLSGAMSMSCSNAFDTPINCAKDTIQLVVQSIQAVGWNTSMLTSLCKDDCKASLSTLRDAVTSGCGSESLNFNSADTTYVKLIDYIQYKYGLVCLSDNGRFCSDIEESWNIQSMVSAGQATWPVHTNKSYPYMLEDNSYYAPTDENGTEYYMMDDNQWMRSDKVATGLGLAALDYYVTKPAFTDYDNFGWNLPLAPDEYPLEIQCSRCFLDRFQYGYESKWGEVWDEVTEREWSNMQANCNLSTSIHPANNYTGSAMSVEDPPDVDIPLSACPRIITTSSSVRMTCNDVSLQYGIATQALTTLNLVGCRGMDLSTQLCAPEPCAVAVVADRQSYRSFVDTYQNITYAQFRAWNPLSAGLLFPNEVVCVGPAGGAFNATLVKPAYPTTFTTTAQPADPTPSGTISNCGLYYKLQDGDACNTVALSFKLTLDQFYAMNTFVDSTCSNVQVGYDYCVAPVDGTTVLPLTTTRPPSSSQSTSSAAFPVPPAPTPPGTISQCTTWYKVFKTDTCAVIALVFQTSLAQLRLWNPSINAQCDNLVAGDAYCVKGPTTSPATTTTTTSLAPTATFPAPPAPTVPGTTSQCTAWYKVFGGDTCAVIALVFQITVDQFRSWNTAVDAGCTNLWAGYAYCVKGPRAPSSATTAAPPGSATPSPHQPNMVRGCKKFYLAVAGDYCQIIAQRNGLDTQTFIGWNPDVGAGCGSLWAGDYYCVGV